MQNDTWVLSNADGSSTPAWTQLSPTGTLPTRAATLRSGTIQPKMQW